MPRNSQGDFSNVRNWPQDEANGINIEADLHQEGDDDQAQGLTDSLDRLGRGGMQADLAMGNFKLTQVQDGSDASDGVPISQIQGGDFTTGSADVGAADAYITGLTPAITAYTDGLRLTFIAANANTGASTLQVNGVVPGEPLRWQGQELPANTINAGDLIAVEYRGTEFHWLNVPALLPVEFGGTGQTTPLGTASGYDVGTAAGELAELDANRVFAVEQQGMIGQMTMWAGASAPNTWEICDGGSLDTTAYAALFAVIGYTYGGAGASFSKPDMRGRAPIGVGAVDGTGTARALADKVGEEEVTLTVAEMPIHDHQAGLGDNNITAPHGTEGTQPNRYTTAVQQSDEFLTGERGGDGAHNNMQPSLTVNYLIKAGYAV